MIIINTSLKTVLGVHAAKLRYEAISLYCHLSDHLYQLDCHTACRVCLMQDKVLEEQERVRASQERVRQQQQQQQERARAKQAAALNKASQRSKGTSRMSPSPAVTSALPQQATVDAQSAAAGVTGSVAGKSLEIAEQPIMNSAAAALVSLGNAAAMGTATDVSEVIPVATPSPSTGPKLFQFGGKKSRASLPQSRSSASPLPTGASPLTSRASPSTSRASPLPSSASPLLSSPHPLSSSPHPLSSSASPLPSSATPLPSSATPLPSSASPLPVMTQGATAAAAIGNTVQSAAAFDNTWQGTGQPDAAQQQPLNWLPFSSRQEPSSVQQRAAAAEAKLEAAMTAPLLSGSRPVAATDAAVRRGGIRSSTASPVPSNLPKTASPSPGLGEDSESGSTAASPLLGQAANRQGAGRSLRAGQVMRPPSVLSQGSVHTALQHILQRLPAD